MSTATELLRRALDRIDWVYPSDIALKDEIRTFLAAEPEADEDKCEKFLNTKLPFPVKFANGKNGAGTTIRTLLIRLENQNKHVEELIKRVKASAAPEAEPVAWRLRLPLKDVWHFQDDQESVEALCLKGWIAEPLYTKPSPARKPMDWKEMQVVLHGWGSTDGNMADLIRAIEKHYGIGGDDD